MTQVFLASTPFTLASMAAAIDEGRFDETGSCRRVLLTYSSAYAPETMLPLPLVPGMKGVLKRFDDVLSWNELIYPYHAHEWAPHTDDALMIRRLLQESWRLGAQDPELVLEAVQVNPALALATIFPDSGIHVVSDGLMTYGPTRNKLPLMVGSRIEQLLHADLVPGLTPVFLSEHGVPARHIHGEALGSVLAEVAAECRDVLDGGTRGARGPVSVVLGQYLSALGILDQREEEQLHTELVVRAARATGGRVLFKPHPAAPPASVTRTVEAARGEGVRVEVSDVPAPGEVLCRELEPDLVVSCFSTGTVTASRLFGLPVAAHGTGRVLDRVRPYHNSNRIPTTIAHAFVPRLTEDGVLPPRAAGSSACAEQQLVTAVAYCMQPVLYPGLRADAERFVRSQDEQTVQRYLGRDQQLLLGLVGAGRPLMRTASVSRRLRAGARRHGGRVRRRLLR